MTEPGGVYRGQRTDDERAEKAQTQRIVRERTQPASQPASLSCQSFSASLLETSKQCNIGRCSCLTRFILGLVRQLCPWLHAVSSSLLCGEIPKIHLSSLQPPPLAPPPRRTQSNRRQPSSIQSPRSKVWLYSCAAPLSLSWSLAAAVPDTVSRLRRYLAWHNPRLAWGSFVKAPSPPTPTLLSSFPSNRPAAANERTNNQPTNQPNKQTYKQTSGNRIRRPTPRGVSISAHHQGGRGDFRRADPTNPKRVFRGSTQFKMSVRALFQLLSRVFRPSLSSLLTSTSGHSILRYITRSTRQSLSLVELCY